MPNYVDAFVVPVPVAQLAAYRRMARKSGQVWLDHGALEYRECVADDVQPGKLTSFPQSVDLQDGETVVLATVVYKSRKHRDAVMAKVMVDTRLTGMVRDKKMPFDPARMFFGGFKTIVSL